MDCSPNPVFLAGAYFIFCSICWALQNASNFIQCQRRKSDFKSDINYPFCIIAKQISVVSIVKVLGDLAIVIWCSVNIICHLQKGEKVDKFDEEFLTIFVVFLLSDLIDICVSTNVCTRFSLKELNYVALVFAFIIQKILYMSHELQTPPIEAATFGFASLLSLSCAIVIGLEKHHRDTIWLPIIRSYCSFVLGTWLCQISTDLTSLTSQISDKMNVYLFFSWHCGAAFILILLLWVIALRCTSISKCSCCFRAKKFGEEESVFLDNRVHFDYHMIDKLDSDCD